LHKDRACLLEVSHEESVDRRNVRDRARLCSEHVGASRLDKRQSDFGQQSRDHCGRVPAGWKRVGRDRYERHNRLGVVGQSLGRSVHVDERTYGVGRLEFHFGQHGFHHWRGREHDRVDEQSRRERRFVERRRIDRELSQQRRVDWQQREWCGLDRVVGRHGGRWQFEQRGDERIDLRPRRSGI
jgi:hypothetical protein